MTTPADPRPPFRRRLAPVLLGVLTAASFVLGVAQVLAIGLGCGESLAVTGLPFAGGLLGIAVLARPRWRTRQGLVLTTAALLIGAGVSSEIVVYHYDCSRAEYVP